MDLLDGFWRIDVVLCILIIAISFVYVMFFIFGPLGYLLRASLNSLGVSWGLFDASWGLLRTSWRPLGASWGAPGTFWKLLGGILGPLGASWGPLGGILGPPGSLLESHGRSFGGITEFY